MFLRCRRCLCVSLVLLNCMRLPWRPLPLSLLAPGTACLGDSLRLLEINVKRMKLLLISKRLGRRLFLKMLVVSSVLEVGDVFDAGELVLFVRSLIRITRSVPVGKECQSSGLMFFEQPALCVLRSLRIRWIMVLRAKPSHHRILVA